jgi:hypothetical protein
VEVREAKWRGRWVKGKRRQTQGAESRGGGTATEDASYDERRRKGRDGPLQVCDGCTAQHKEESVHILHKFAYIKRIREPAQAEGLFRGASKFPEYNGIGKQSK